MCPSLLHFSRMLVSSDRKCRRAEQHKMPTPESISKITPLAAIPGYEIVEVLGRGNYALVYVSTNTQRAVQLEILSVGTNFHA